MTLSMKLSETFREGRAEGITEGVFRAVSLGMLTLENASALLEKPVAVITEEMKERGFSLPEK